MRTASLNLKLISLTVGTILIVIFMFSGLVYVNFREIFRKQLVDKGVQLADFLNKHSSISYGIMAEERFLLSEAINLFMRDEDVIFASAINKNGDILAFRTKNDKIVPDMSWFISGMVSGNVISDSRRIIERTTSTGEEVIIFFYPVKSEGLIKEEGSSVKGYTVLVMTLQNFYKDFSRRIMNISFIIGIITVITIVVISYLIRSNLRPLIELKEKAEKVSKEGELREKVEVETGDEVQEIADSFSRMIDMLKNEIHNIKIVSKKLSDMSHEVFKAMEKINSNTGEQNSKIRQIESLVDSIHERELSTVTHIDSVIEAIESVLRRISEIDDSLSYIRNSLQTFPQKMDEFSSGILELKRVGDEFGETDRIISNVDDFSRNFSAVKKVLAEASEEAREINLLFDVVNEGIYQIISESDNISSCVINTRKLRNELSELLSSAQKEIEDITSVVFELLDFTDDTNMLAINASIIASHEKGEKGKEFGVVAEEIKKLSQDTESKIRNIRDKIRSIKQKISSALRISDANIEEKIVDISNTKESISAGINKAKNMVEDLKGKFNKLLNDIEKSEQGLSTFDFAVNSIRDLSQKIIKFVEVARKDVERAEPIVRELNSSVLKVLDEIQGINEKIKKATPAITKFTSELLSVKEESRSQFSEIESIKDKTKDLGNIIYEINKTVIFSLSKVKTVSELGEKLETITKRYKT